MIQRATRIATLIICIACVASPAQASAERADGARALDRSAPYANQCVVRIRTTSQAQLDAVLDIAGDVWSERIGVGVLEIQMDREQLGQLGQIGVPHDMLIADLREHVLDEQRQIRSIRQAQSRSNPDGFQRGTQVHDDAWFETYRTLDEITTYIGNIATLRPDLAQIDIIGQSWEGRDMFSITVSGPDTPENPVADRPAVFIFSTVHAREWIAPMTTSYIASKLAEQYDLDPEIRSLLDRSRVVVVPVGNPDGYLFTWSDQRFWRNTRRDNGNGSFGVNINRNWGYEWGGEGSSAGTNSTNYRGTEPFSEPETRALRDVGLELGDELLAHIDYHSYSQLIMWPFGHESIAFCPEPYVTAFEEIATEMSSAIFDVDGEAYEPIQSVDLYPAAGNSPDWFFGELNKLSYTIELRTRNSFSPPPSEIFPCAEENFAAFLVYIENATRPNRLIHNPVATHYTNDPEPIRLYSLSGFEPELNDPAYLLYRKVGDADFAATTMTLSEDNEFLAFIPGIQCADTIEYYFSLQTTSGDIITLPDDWGSSIFTTQILSKALSFTDDMESDSGWIAGLPDDLATSGMWTRSDPEWTPQQTGVDHSPNGTHCWVTDGRSGQSPDDFDVDEGGTNLVSPRFSAIDGSVISLWFWRSESRERFDRADLYVSNNDGMSWTFIGRLPRQTKSWHRFEVAVPISMTPTHNLRLRVSVRDIRDDSTIELAIDDVSVGVPGCPVNDADLNADGSLNFLDVSLFIDAFQADSTWADFTDDGRNNFFDVAEFLRIFLES